jgi:hypothetical protein
MLHESRKHWDCRCFNPVLIGKTRMKF